MPSAEADRERAQAGLRLLHWNIHSWRDEAGERNVEAVAGLIRDTAPHVVSLVEVDEEWQAPGTLDVLAERCGYAAVFAPAFEFGDDGPRGGFGNALLTTLPILAVRHRHLVWPVPAYDGTEASEPRSLLLVKISFHGMQVWIGSTHLPRCDVRARGGALRQLKAIAAGLDGPWIVCGDFNVPAAEWVGEADDLTVWPDPPEATYPVEEPSEAIDYCVAPVGMRVEAAVLEVRGSDHRAVVVAVQLRADSG